MFREFKILAFLMIMFVLVGCGSFTRQDLLQSEKTQKLIYIVDKNYQQVHFDISRKLEECYAWESGGVGLKVTGQVYPDLNKAEVVMKFDDYYRVLAVLKKMNQTKTQVTLYNGFYGKVSVENLRDILLNKKSCK